MALLSDSSYDPRYFSRGVNGPGGGPPPYQVPPPSSGLSGGGFPGGIPPTTALANGLDNSGGGMANFNPPAYTGPTAPTLPNLPNFSFPKFQAPTLAQAEAMPGYQFELQQGEGALQNSAAARGVLNTGGTLEGILNYGQQAAQQNYSNMYNQALQAYGANLGAYQATTINPEMTQFGLQGQGALAAYQNALQLYEFQQQAALQAEQLAQTPPAGLT